MYALPCIPNRVVYGRASLRKVEKVSNVCSDYGSKAMKMSLRAMLIASLESFSGKQVNSRSKKYTGFRMPNGSSSEMSRVLWVSNSEDFPELRRGDTVSKSYKCQDEVIPYLQAAVLYSTEACGSDPEPLDAETLQAIQSYLVGLADMEMALKGKE